VASTSDCLTRLKKKLRVKSDTFKKAPGENRYSVVPVIKKQHRHCRTALKLLLGAFITILIPASSVCGQPSGTHFNLSAKDLSLPFEKFMECNAGELSQSTCTADPAAAEFLFDNETITTLKKYQFIFVPGGDFDFFGELLGLCEGHPAENLDAFIDRHPALGKKVKGFILKNVCPSYKRNNSNLYNKFMGAYQEYKDFFSNNKIPYAFLASYVKRPLTHIGDRAGKLDLLADTIDSIGAESSTRDRRFVLIGHSFGGLNIADFLVELAGGHAPGTPEYKLFANTKVRRWPLKKKEKIFNEIKGAAFINAFLQGDAGPETRLTKVAEENKLKSADPVGYYIQYILENYPSGRLPDTPQCRQILAFTLISARYRTNYYLQDKNTLTPNVPKNIQSTFERIAHNSAIISIGCVVSRSFQELPDDQNFLVFRSRKKWKQENLPNDGLVNSYSTVFPRPSAEYAILYNKDHGSLVLKPQVSGISGGHSYNQIPFIKTLLKHMESKMKEKAETTLPGK